MEVAPDQIDAVVGRDRELAAVSLALDLLPRGPRALVIEGEAGIGKTTIWFAAVHDAGREDVDTLHLVVPGTA